jgi:hypothetical protein
MADARIDTIRQWSGVSSSHQMVGLQRVMQSKCGVPVNYNPLKLERAGRHVK